MGKTESYKVHCCLTYTYFKSGGESTAPFHVTQILLEGGEAQQLPEAAANRVGLGEAFMSGFFLRQWRTALKHTNSFPTCVTVISYLCNVGKDT